MKEKQFDLRPFKIGRRELLEHLVTTGKYSQWENVIEKFNFGLNPGIKKVNIGKIIIGKDINDDIIKITLA